MSTPFWQLLPYARVFLGDLDSSKYKYTDDTIVLVLQACTAILELLGYDQNYTSNPDGVVQTLSESEKALWGRCAATLLQDPDATKSALEAVSVRTLGTSYSTEARARFLEASSSKAFIQLRQMIRALSEPMVSPLDDLDIDVPSFSV